MQNAATTVLALTLAAVILLLVPLVTLTDRYDNVVQENVKLIVEEFVTEIRNTGKLSRTQYQDFVDRLSATGNEYDIEIEIHYLDENPGKKLAQANYTKIGENVYYIEYDTQTMNRLDAGTILLYEGCFVYVRVKNINSTQAQTLKSSLLSFSNADQYVIQANSSGMVTANGKD